MTLLHGTPVRDITWSRDRSVLNIEVADPRLTEISFRVENGKLSHTCECGAPSGCRHLICALFTLKKLLSPHLFQHIRFGKRYDHELSAAFIGIGSQDTARTPSLPFRIVVERGIPGFHPPMDRRPRRYQTGSQAEVRCHGVEVSEREMAEALNGGGIYRKNGEFVMLDGETTQRPRSFSGPREKGQ